MTEAALRGLRRERSDGRKRLLVTRPISISILEGKRKGGEKGDGRRKTVRKTRGRQRIAGLAKGIFRA